jgi:hypothetical protein
VVYFTAHKGFIPGTQLPCVCGALVWSLKIPCQMALSFPPVCVWHVLSLPAVSLFISADVFSIWVVMTFNVTGDFHSANNTLASSLL